jgi:hypothetical protein
MGKVKLILGLAVLGLVIIGGWQIASCELANLELHEELHDLAAQTGAYIGLNPFNTDEDFRNAIIRAAKRHEIQLEPEQVTVERTGSPPKQIIFLAADYKARVTLPGFSFTLHFHPSSAR